MQFKRHSLLLFFLTCFVFSVISNEAAARVYYDIDFSAPRHTAGEKPNVGSSAEDVSKIIFGKPDIMTSQDTTANQFLAFNTEGNKPDFFYDQIELNLYGSSDFYYISFDILTKNLINSRNQFTVFAPQKFTFQSNGKINFADQYEVQYHENQQMLVEIHVDNKKRQISYFLDKKKVYTAMLSAGREFDGIRFSLGVRYSNQENDTSSCVGIDNIFIADTIPVEKAELTASRKVDQSQRHHDYVADISSDGSTGQMFTAGSEDRLIGVKLLIQGSGSNKPNSPVGSDIRVELHRIYPNGALQPTVVASGVATRQDIVREEPKWIEVIFDRPYKQRAGEKLAFTIKDLSGGGLKGYNNYGFAREDVYEDGFSFMTSSKSPLHPSTLDMAFETLVAELDNQQTLVIGPTRDAKMSFPAPPPGQAQKLAIIWADGNTEMAHLSVKYAYNAKDSSWYDEVRLMIMGPSVKVLALDEKLQGYLKEIMDCGVEVKISSDTAEIDNVADRLKAAGFELRAVEHMLSQMMQSGWKVLSF